MKKPKHRPPKTIQLEQDPKLVLIALNLLIESHKSKALPTEVREWIKFELVDEGLDQLMPSTTQVKRVA